MLNIKVIVFGLLISFNNNLCFCDTDEFQANIDGFIDAFDDAYSTENISPTTDEIDMKNDIGVETSNLGGEISKQNEEEPVVEEVAVTETVFHPGSDVKHELTEELQALAVRVVTSISPQLKLINVTEAISTVTDKVQRSLWLVVARQECLDESCTVFCRVDVVSRDSGDEVTWHNCLDTSSSNEVIRKKRGAIGGFKQVDEAEAKELADIAAQTLDSIDADDIKRVVTQVIRAQKQLVNGIMYHLTLEVASSDCKEDEENCESKLSDYNICKILMQRLFSGEAPRNAQVVKSECAPISKAKEVNNKKRVRRHVEGSESNMISDDVPHKKTYSRSRIVGGKTWQDPNSDSIKEMSEFALAEIDKASNSLNKQQIVRVVDARSQVVAGVKYFLKLELVETNCRKGSDQINCKPSDEQVLQSCEVTIWDKPWEKFRSVTGMHCTPLQTRTKRSLVGGYSRADPNDARVQEMASFALSQLDARSNSLNSQKLVVKEAQTQVVAGMNYKLKIQLVETNCPKGSQENRECNGNPEKVVQECEVVVYDRPWDHHREMTSASCSPAPVNKRVNKRDVQPGGLSPADKESAEAKEIVQFAIEDHNRKSNSIYKKTLVEVVSVHTQVVAGTNYHIKMRVAESECKDNHNAVKSSACIPKQDAVHKECEVIVWSQPWLNRREVTTFKCRPIQNAARQNNPSLTKHITAESKTAAIPKIVHKRDTMAGGHSPADKDSEDVQEVAQFAIEDLNKKSNSMYKQTLVEVISAHTQVVAGINYHLKLRVAESECKKNAKKSAVCALRKNVAHQECDVTVWSRPWLNERRACQSVSVCDCPAMPTEQLFLLQLLAVCLGTPIRYIVISPQTVRPGMVYNVVVMLTSDETQQATVYTSIARDDEVMAEASMLISTNSLATLPIKVAMSIMPGTYSVTVEGRRNGLVLFHNSSRLTFDPRFLSVVVQTSRPLYRAGQEVRFRVVAIHTDLRPFNDGLEIYVLDPDGLIMRRWISAYTNNGVSSLSFKLPKMAKDGYWKIRIKAWNQVDEQIIRVETYFDPLFEVHVKLPPYITEGEESIRGTVSGMFTTQRLVEGNATLTLLARRWNDTEAFLPLWTDHVFFKGKEYQVEIPMDIVVSRIGSLRGVEVKLQASVTELLSRETVEGYSHSRLIPGTLQLTFLSASPAVFKPGLPFYAHVALVYEDREKVSSELLMNSRLRIQVELQLESGRTVRLPDIVAGKDYENSWSIEENIISSETKERFVDELTHDEYLEQGVLRFRFDTTDTTEKIHMKASFVGEDGNTVEAKLEAVQYYSPKRKFISVFPSSNNVAVDEYAIFHVKSNFRLDSFQYLVISKSQIISSGEHKVMNSSVTTSSLSLSLSTEMAPGFTFLVVHIATDGEVLTDSCFLPVDGFSKYNTELEINTGKDHKAERLEVRASGGEGAFIGVTAVRAAIYTLQAGHEISLGRLTQRLMLLENSTRKFNKMHWKTRDGTSADKIHYFTSMNNAYDTNHTFKLADLVVFSSENVLHNPSPVVCDLVTELPCDLISCYPANKTCDGVLDCPSGYDEFMCPVSEEKEFEYKISRMSRNEFLFDMVEGDWAWREIKVNDHKGIEFEPVRAPQTADDWYLTAFSINTDLGFSMISEPVVFSSKRNFMMSMRGPAACYSGEQIALQVDLMNHLDTEALVLLTLKGSPDYRFVNVEEGGKVSSYSARLTSGDHQVLVYLGPESQKHIDFPLTPTIEQGTVEITLVGAAQTGLSVKTHSLLVQGGGATINKHTSVFLDLKSRALVMSYLDIIVEETPIIPYNMNRRYVFGSTSATVEIFGDIIGPAFSTVPATLESILQTSSKGTLARVFEFGVNIWTLHYLRLTNKLQRPFLKQVLLECNAIYAQILKRFNARGSFENWDSSGFSVWLTAWTLRVLKAATYPDWEFLLHVDPRVIERGVAWLLQYQTPNGSFYDPSPPLDSKMNSQRRDVTLTAHILTTLCECMVLLSGEVKTRAVVASQRAATYLQQSLSSLSDPLHLALTVHALSVSLGHGDIQHGYHSLLRMQRQNSAGFIYWSPIEIPANPVKKENQRPFLQPRLYHEQDSVAVESTALVLLVILHREGVTQTTENIVHWLNSIRMTSGGFVSTVDTLVALQALTEYAFRARLHEITNMDVTVEFPMSGNKKHKVHIDNSSILFQTELTVPQVWGNVLVVGHGTGQAVVQMSVHYGVDHEALVEVPTVPSFDLNITEYYSTYRNKSALTIQSCLRWLREQPESSSAATLEVDSPSGYHLLESQAERVARHGSHPTLRDALVTHRKTVWFFDKIEKDWTCFNYTLRRWFPVANMSRHRQALLYEATARERFVQVLVNSTPLHVLNICEVCGSYQCPYCPHYNTAALSLIWLHLLTLSQIVLNVYI